MYARFRGYDCAYVGPAGTSLRSRLSAHLTTTTDLSRITLRATVAVHQLRVTRAIARSRLPILTADQVGVVSEWLHACDVAWLTRPTRLAAVALEKALRETRLPRLNLM
ncbi:GIY-YIG nuclease family protein [Promicromonospora sp. NPDC060204]|uniref:GIY-YIG nuclease family protein n=1 Tax=Promicromonospora sp. NPDC060204 TaxID=3347071 RepID=UPI003665789C